MKTITMLLLLLCLFACSDKNDVTDPYLRTELENNVFNVPVEGKNGSVKIYTNLKNIELKPQVSGGYDWCKTSISMTSSDVHILTLTVAPNDDVDMREANYVISGNGVGSVSIRIVQLGTESAILSDVESKKLSKEKQSFSIKVTANVLYTIKNGQDWLTLVDEPTSRGMVESEYTFDVTDNPGLSVRRDTICIESAGQNTEPVVLKIPVEQEPADIDDVFEEDKKTKVESVKMIQGTVYGTSVPDNTIDGDLSTYYGSGTSSKWEPVILEYTLQEGTEKVDYVILRQRKDATVHNQLTKGEIEYKSATVKDWTKCGSFDESAIVPSIRVDVNVVKPTQLRLTLERTAKPNQGSVALAEFECYQKSKTSNFDLTADAVYFEDNVFSKLKPTTTKADIAKITHPMVRAVAQELLNGTYSTEFRSRTYKSCKSPVVVGNELTIGKRSVCDNPTGLYFQKDKKYIVFVGSEIGDKVFLYIKDWRENGESQTVSLKRGVNTITTNVEGNGYIQYWTDTDASAPAVKVHVCYGNEIGFWDVRAGHTNKDWKRILDMANTCANRLGITNAMLDVLGERVQLVNTVEAFNTCCPDNIEDVLDMHDELMLIEYKMLGLVKNNAVPKNRMLGVRSWGGSPNWNGTCANFPNSEATMLNRTSFISNLWLFGHEFGHGNQVAQMKGAGWTEVTNNIFSQQVMYEMNNGACRLEDTEYKRQGYDDKVTGDRFNAYLNDALVKDKPYLTHEGSVETDSKYGEYNSADPFVSLAPLWQLSLFFMLTEDAPWSKQDFWPDVHWAAIHDNNSSYTYGQKYVNFMKRAMDASGVNLTEFFKKMGLLREMDMKVGDYGSPKEVKITKAMVEEVENYGKKKSSPSTPVIYYISNNSLNAYKKRLAVEGTFNQGVTSGDLSKTISHSVWKNVAAFETYCGDKLVEVCIAGTGTANNSSTFVRYPKGSTRIEAVSWDGKRTLVYGAR